ncbi:MFS transporter [Caproiciproducens faecalis]|uniref:MFS transporter n=1 Tax=Caproiciproducens faecalis TaxID=2820301 RepID=A0ABS7DP56_9FIRM|nr:MFS transporter [Caproiciproducens faecalis]MBW7572978.1 MFS transporter [Caproiciproducens faecalis]
MIKITRGLSIMLALGLCGAFAVFSSTISKSPILPVFAKSLGANGAQIGWIASASTLPGILVSYLAGDLADRFGYQKILTGSLIVFASAPFAYFLVVNPVGLAGVRFYHGFATAAFDPVAMAAIAAFSRNNTGQNLSLYTSATLVGRALAPTVGGAAYEYGGIPAVYGIAGGAGILALACALWFFHKNKNIQQTKKEIQQEKTKIEKTAFLKKLWNMLRYRPLLLVGILNACAYFAYSAFEMIFPLYARQLGMSTGQIGFVLGAQLVGMILLKPAFGRVSDRVGRLPLMAAGLFVCAGSFFLLAAVSKVLIVIPLVVVYGLGFALITSGTNALAADVAQKGQLGASLGVMSTLMDVGQTLGPPAIGAVSDRYSYTAGIGTLGGILLLAAAGCVFALLRQRKNPV